MRFEWSHKYVAAAAVTAAASRSPLKPAVLTMKHKFSATFQHHPGVLRQAHHFAMSLPSVLSSLLSLPPSLASPPCDCSATVTGTILSVSQTSQRAYFSRLQASGTPVQTFLRKKTREEESSRSWETCIGKQSLIAKELS